MPFSAQGWLPGWVNLFIFYGDVFFCLFQRVQGLCYRLFAGNDSDNDDYILGSWEAAGGYKTVEIPTLIYVNSDISDIEFFTGYNFAISASTLAVPSNTSRKEVIKEVAKP